MESDSKQLIKEKTRALQEQNKGLSQEEKQALRKQKKLEKQMAKQKATEKNENQVAEAPLVIVEPSVDVSCSVSDNKDSVSLSKEEIRALQEQNKGMSQEEKQALRKQKKLEKQMAKQKAVEKIENNNTQPIESIHNDSITKQEDELKTESVKSENISDSTNQGVSNVSNVSNISNVSIPVPNTEKKQLTKEEIRALQEQNKGMSQEEKQALRKQKKLEKQMAKQPVSTPSSEIVASASSNVEKKVPEELHIKPQNSVQTSSVNVIPKNNNVPKPKSVSIRPNTQAPELIKRQSLMIKSEQSTKNIFGYTSNPTSLTSQELLELFGTNKNIHPLVLKYGLFLTNRLISGSNTHAQVLLNVLSHVILDFQSEQNYLSELLNYIHIQWSFIKQCKIPTAAMTSVYTHIRECLTKYDRYVNREDAKALFEEDVNTYKIQLEANSHEISEMISAKIDNDDIILTYGMSDRILDGLKIAQEKAHKHFRVIVIDSRPRDSSEEMVKECLSNNIQTTYIPLNALPYIMNEVTKCIISSSSMYSDGSALTISGGSLIALACNQHNIPFLIACESYKFSNEIYLDSTVKNEILDPHVLRPPHGDKWILEKFDDPSSQLKQYLDILVLSYDLIPASFITGVFTENTQNGLIPSSSIAFLCRQI